MRHHYIAPGGLVLVVASLHKYNWYSVIEPSRALMWAYETRNPPVFGEFIIVVPAYIRLQYGLITERYL